MWAFPGYTSFPGGKIDSLDPSPEAALEREVAEEVGINLKVLKRRGIVKKISYLGRAETPDFIPVKFETLFFRIDLQKLVNFTPDSREIAQIYWEEPDELLRLYRSGKILLVPPTLRIFKALAENFDTEHIEELNYHYSPEKEVPAVEPIGSLVQLMPRSQTLPPADRTNAFLLGDDGSKKVLIDPSPQDKSEYDKFKYALKRQLGEKQLDQIFLTHHHGDHHQFAPQLGREFSIPLAMSQDTHQRINAKWGSGYLDGLSVEHKAEGDTLTHWSGQKVLLYATPGHDSGQLTLMPESRDWAIVGDLIQGIGTVVIAAPEGDMQTYLQSLERMIDLAPAVIFPSHGMASGGVDKLINTHKHRLEREKQIYPLWKEGCSEQEILSQVYSHLPPELSNVAIETIRSHIRKLELES